MHPIYEEFSFMHDIASSMDNIASSVDERSIALMHFTRLVAGGSTNLKKISWIVKQFYG